MFRYHLLGLLHHGEAVHGYALIKEYNHRTGRRVRTGNAYRELRKLEDDGLVRSVSVVSEPTVEGHLRVPYEITARGIHAFDEWFRTVPDPTLPEDRDVAGRLIFFGDVAPGEADGIIASWEQGLLEARKGLEKQIMRALKGENLSRRLLLQRRRELVSADLRFVQLVKEEYGLKGEPSRLERDAQRARRAASRR